MGALWSHQADLLRTYIAEHRDSRDVALELPTGSGKTLVGLLIAEWRRRALGHRVVYACPTKQLARQVQQAAAAQSIPTVVLIGSNRNWAPADVARYSGAECIAITTYSAIFNTNSHLPDAQALLFDDAHAAEGYVAEAWSLAVAWDSAAFSRLLDAVRPDLDAHMLTRLTAAEAEAGPRADVWLLPPPVVNRHIELIDQILNGELVGDATYAFRMIRPGLRSCLFYLSPSRIYIRPYAPPTSDHPPYADPVQRIYLSATLGEAGELERSFGRSLISRVPVPPAWERTGSGRRFFVFADLVERGGADRTASDHALLTELLSITEKRLILTPDDRLAIKIADTLAVPEQERFTARDADAGLRPFLEAAKGTLLAPNRYDGMDLPGDACRVMVLAGLPRAMNLQDQFLISKLRAGNVITERVRTRVMQGAGRCTRGPKDYAVVVVQDPDLLRFLSRGDIQQAMPVELQAEIGFGLYTSTVSAEDLVLLARSAIDQDETWQQQAEPDIAERRRDATRVALPESANLATTAPREVAAWEAAWRQDWATAAMHAVDTFDHLTVEGLRPYRSFWAYLASCWFGLAADAGVPGAAEQSERQLTRAHAAAVGTTWLREVQRLPALIERAYEPVDDEAVTGVLAALAGLLKSATKVDKITAEMLAALAKPAASGYEQALVSLGLLVGAASSKPAGKGRADAVWVWPSLWLTLEAKSEQMSAGTLSMDYVRQANTHLDSVRADREEEPPAGSCSVIVSPRTVVDPDAVPIAATHVHLLTPATIMEISTDSVRAIKKIRAAIGDPTTEGAREVVAATLWEHNVLPTQLRVRLTVDPVRTG